MDGWLGKSENAGQNVEHCEEPRKNARDLEGIWNMVNNYFDGPFDQLPDNFIKGNALRNAFVHQVHIHSILQGEHQVRLCAP